MSPQIHRLEDRAMSCLEYIKYGAKFETTARRQRTRVPETRPLTWASIAPARRPATPVLGGHTRTKRALIDIALTETTTTEIAPLGLVRIKRTLTAKDPLGAPYMLPTHIIALVLALLLASEIDPAQVTTYQDRRADMPKDRERDSQLVFHARRQ